MRGGGELFEKEKKERDLFEGKKKGNYWRGKGTI